jgi:crossover junction endodeoxyribonuclease RuvC
MIILGIDPAIRCTGYGVIEMQTPDRAVIRDCGIIKNHQKLTHSECLLRIAGGIRELVNTFKPECASIEDPFFGKNVKTLLILGMARGAILTVLAEHNIPVYPYSPRKAKRAAVGSGAASKEQVAAMMAAMFNIRVTDIPLDSTDALSLALCHGQMAMRAGSELLLPQQL